MAEALAVRAPDDGALAASLLGLTFPGAGFLHWASGEQIISAFIVFAAGLCLVGFALLLWFGTGNIIAFVGTWIGLALMAGHPRLMGMASQRVDGHWPWLIGPTLLAVCILVWWRSGRLVPTAEGRIEPVFAIPKEAETSPPELSQEDGRRLRLLLDRALQPLDRFDGFERRDQFQTAALRYQVNFMAYALAMAGRRHAPAAQACFAEAQRRLLAKIGDRRLWSYWGLENAWGNLRLDPDPVPRQNIMYSGFTALQMALGGGDTLNLHRAGNTWKTYELDDIAELLSAQYRSSSYGLLACEPNWIYPLCNLITMAGIKASDARLGADRWQALAAPFLANLEREGMRPDGSFVAFRSSLTGIAPPAPGGVVMQAFPCLFLNALAPELAQRQWQRVRQRLDHGSWRRLFWPVDVGNYGFSRASSYAATAAAAAEMGDREVAEECLRRLEDECPSREVHGVIHRERASLWAHALEIFARCNPADGLRNLVGNKVSGSGPYLRSAPYPHVLILHAVRANRGLHLVIAPGQQVSAPLVEFGGLLPERHYRTGVVDQPILKADREGRALLRLSLRERTRITIEPVL